MCQKKTIKHLALHFYTLKPKYLFCHWLVRQKIKACKSSSKLFSFQSLRLDSVVLHLTYTCFMHIWQDRNLRVATRSKIVHRLNALKSLRKGQVDHYIKAPYSQTTSVQVCSNYAKIVEEKKKSALMLFWLSILVHKPNCIDHQVILFVKSHTMPMKTQINRMRSIYESLTSGCASEKVHLLSCRGIKNFMAFQKTQSHKNLVKQTIIGHRPVW